MPKIFCRSLRSRILLLAVLTFLFLSAAAVSLFTFLRNRHAETLSLTERHLVSVASNLAPFGPGDGTLGDLAASVNVAKLSSHTSAFVSTAYQFNATYRAESVLAGFKLAW